MILQRIALAVLIVVLGWLAYRLWNHIILTRRNSQRLMLREYRPGRPAILYFTAPGCLPCKTIQRPALSQLRRTYNDKLQFIEVDASKQPKLADSWGVLSLPTTFIIDSMGQPRRVNHGAVGADQLIAQLNAIHELLPGDNSTSQSHEGRPPTKDYEGHDPHSNTVHG